MPQILSRRGPIMCSANSCQDRVAWIADGDEIRLWSNWNARIVCGAMVTDRLCTYLKLMGAVSTTGTGTPFEMLGWNSHCLTASTAA